MCVSTLTCLHSCGFPLARSILILWILPSRPTAPPRLHRGRATYFPISRDTLVRVPQELIYFLRMSLTFRDPLRTRSIYVFPIPHWSTQQCSIWPSNMHAVILLPSVAGLWAGKQSMAPPSPVMTASSLSSTTSVAPSQTCFLG